MGRSGAAPLHICGGVRVGSGGRVVGRWLAAEMLRLAEDDEQVL